MLRLVTLAVLLALSPAALAQDSPPPLTEEEGWRSRLLGTVSLNQAQFSNWQEGGVNAIAASAQAEGRFQRLIGELKQTHDLQLAFGVLKQDSLDFRKAADEIVYDVALQHVGGGAWQPFAAAGLRTQFARGFDYNVEPGEYDFANLPFGPPPPGSPLRVSSFLSPAYFTQTVGLAYDPDRWYRARLGLGLKETVVSESSLRPLYGNRVDQVARVQAGLDALVEAQGEPTENVVLLSRVSSFYAFGQLDTAPDVRWLNRVTLQANDVFSANLEVVTFYDRDLSPDLQLKQIFSLGLSLVLI